MSETADGQMPEDQLPFVEELAASLRNDHFDLILLPTEHCNFRCTYCYEDFSIGRMRSETIQGIKRLIDRRVDSLRSLSVSWFGGEPLLARAVIEDISEHIVRAAAERPGLHYEGDITTNGYLLDILAVERLAELGIRLFQITLDGPEPFHDRTRVRADGKGSFRQIWQNLLAVRDGTVPVNVVLRVHLTSDNLPVMREFLMQIRETFLQDSRFRVLLKPIEHLGGPNDDTVEIIPMEARPRILAELEAIVLEGADTRRLYPAAQVCYAARPNSLMIRANGLIGKCTVALTDPRNTIGRLLPDGSLQIDNARLRLWLHGWASRDWAALECPYAGFPPIAQTPTDQRATSLIRLAFGNSP
jgi:uncharacterized protein